MGDEEWGEGEGGGGHCNEGIELTGLVNRDKSR